MLCEGTGENVDELHQFDDFIPRVQDSDLGTHFPGFRRGAVGKGHHNDLVARLSQSGHRSIELNLPIAPLAHQDIGLAPLPIVAVGDQYLFVWQEIHSFHQIFGDRDTAMVTQLRRGDGRLVKFGLENADLHQCEGSRGAKGTTSEVY